MLDVELERAGGGATRSLRPPRPDRRPSTRVGILREPGHARGREACVPAGRSSRHPHPTKIIATRASLVPFSRETGASDAHLRGSWWAARTAGMLQRSVCKLVFASRTVHRDGPETFRLTDERTWPALAHPLRSRLLGLLRADGPATASGLAERIGESSGVTSYHLRKLAEVGLVEEDVERGTRRERWWRTAHQVTSWSAGGLPRQPGRPSGLGELAPRGPPVAVAVMEQWLAEESEWDKAWVDAAGHSDSPAGDDTGVAAGDDATRSGRWSSATAQHAARRRAPTRPG